MKQLLIAPIAAAGLFAAACEDTTAPDPATETPTVEAPADIEPAPMPEPVETVSMTATLAPGEGIESDGTGSGEFTFDPATNTLTYNITYAGLTGPAGAAHIHGPAAPGENAGVIVPFESAESPITGTATLTEPQVEELMEGMYYVNVHTAANGGGEIRGQIVTEDLNQ